MKKLLWILGGLFIALLVAIVTIPFFVNVDQYRPVIEQEANKRMNGKLELGKLKLGLWGAIKIHAESIRVLVNGFEKPLVDTKNFHLEVPFSSVFSGKPQVVAVLETPKVSITKLPDGRMNVMELLKVPGTQAEAAPVEEDTIRTTDAAPAKEKALPKDVKAPPVPKVAAMNTLTSTSTSTVAATEATTVVASEPSAPAATTALAEPAKVPALLANATLGLRIEKGEVHYSDQASKLEQHINGLDLDARNLGLGSTMNLTFVAPLKGSMPSMTLEGPVAGVAEITPLLVDGKVRSVRGMVDVNATKLGIKMTNGMFQKADSVILTAKATFDGDEKETLLKNFDLQFHNVKLNGKGRITMEPTTAKVEVSAEPVRLDRMQDLVPLLAQYQLKGLLNFNANVDWQPTALRVSGDFKASEGSVFAAQYLKAPLEFQLQGGFTESTFTLVRANLAGPESDLQLTGNVKNFLAPQFAFGLSGKSLNVDKVLVLPQAGASAAPTKTAAAFSLVSEAFAAEENKAADTNPMTKFAANPIVAKASGTLNAQIGKVTAYNNQFDQAVLKSNLQNMQLKVADASFRTFSGLVKASGDFNLANPALSYKTRGSVSGLQGQQAFAAYFPKYKNTLEGIVDANWDVSGAAYPAAQRMRSLSGTAKLLAKDGVLKSVDVQDSINSAMKKVPFLKDKKPLQINDGFRTLNADLKFSNGVISVEPLEVQPRDKGVVLKGKGTINESLAQDFYLDVFDPQGVLPNEIQVAGKPALQFHVTGLLTAPQLDYEYTVKRLASTAGKATLKKEAGKLLDKYIGGSEGGSSQDKLKEAADKLRKKFKF